MTVREAKLLTATLTPFPDIPSTGLPEGVTAWFSLRLSRALAADETAILPLTLGGDATRGTDYTLELRHGGRHHVQQSRKRRPVADLRRVAIQGHF